VRLALASCAEARDARASAACQVLDNGAPSRRDTP
jgi:hypothetical protein